MNNKFKGFRSGAAQLFTSPAAAKTSIFAPGMFFILLGVLAFVAPKFLGLVIALFFLFVGALFCILAWRFMQLKKRFEATFKDLGSRVTVQTYHYGDYEETTGFEELDQKKIIIH